MKPSTANSVVADRTERVEEALRAAQERFTAANPLSRAQHERAASVLPGGHTRQTLFYQPFPVTMVRGEGAWIVDLDGHRYLDLVNDYGAGLFGHTCEPIQRAIFEAVTQGVSWGSVNDKEVELAELITRRIQSMEQIRFCNSGTEACLYAVGLASHVTGKRKLLAFKGCYHGGFMIYDQADPPLNVPFEVVKCTYNDLEGTRAALREHAGSLAAVILEPMMGAGGSIPATPEFLAMLREEARSLGVQLIFDEVMTSRLGPGGLQGVCGVRPDITAIGKFWGGGASFGAFGASREMMSRFDLRTGGVLSQAGTFNNNIITMAAGVAAATLVYTPEVCIRLNETGDWLRQELNALARATGVAMQVTGRGSLMTLHWHDRPIRHPGDTEPASSPYRSLFQIEMLLAGFYVTQRGFITLSLPLTDQELRSFLHAVRGYLGHHAELFA